MNELETPRHASAHAPRGLCTSEGTYRVLNVAGCPSNTPGIFLGRNCDGHIGTVTGAPITNTERFMSMFHLA